MKTIGDLFNINTRGISYDDIFVYIHNVYRCSISKVWSDSSTAISFEEDDKILFITIDKTEEIIKDTRTEKLIEYAKGE